MLLKSRTEAFMIWTWVMAVSLLISGNGFPPIRPALLSIISMIFVVASVYFYNDIQDEDMDSLNTVKRNRPIPSNEVNRDNILKIIYVCGLIGLSIAYFVNYYSFLFTLVFYIIFYFYSHPSVRLKTRFLGKDFTLFIGNPIISLIASFAVLNRFSPLTFYVSLLTGLYMLTMGPALNDSSDLLEDKEFGVKSLTTLLSWKQKVQLMIVGILLLMIMMPLIQLQFGANIIVPVISVGMSIILLRLTYPVAAQYNEGKVMKARRFAKIYFFSFQVLFVIITIPYLPFL